MATGASYLTCGIVLGLVVGALFVIAVDSLFASDSVDGLERTLARAGKNSVALIVVRGHALHAFVEKIKDAYGRRTLLTTDDLRAWSISDGTERIYATNTLVRQLVEEERARAAPPVIGTLTEASAWFRNASKPGTLTREAVKELIRAENRVKGSDGVDFAVIIVEIFCGVIHVVFTTPLTAFGIAIFCALVSLTWDNLEGKYKRFFSEKSKLQRFRDSETPGAWLTVDKTLRPHPDEWVLPAENIDGDLSKTRPVGTLTSQNIVIRDVCGGTVRVSLLYGMTVEALDGANSHEASTTAGVHGPRRNKAAEMFAAVEKQIRRTLAHEDADGNLHADGFVRTMACLHPDYVYRISRISWKPNEVERPSAFVHTPDLRTATIITQFLGVPTCCSSVK